MSKCSRKNKLCAMCTYWDGFRLGYVIHDRGDFFEVNDKMIAPCFHPDCFGMSDKKGIQSCPRFKSRF